jgi:4-deoxy-L-threo-5-hexosulose-uronate ketol-isomerase
VTATRAGSIWRVLPAIGWQEAGRLTSAGLRDHFLLQDLFVPGEMRLVYTEHDRMIAGGVVPLAPIVLPAYHELGARFFMARREAGIINLGAPGIVRVGSQTFTLNRLDCLYAGAGEPDLRFEPAGDAPPEFYLLSCPAHQSRPSRLVRNEEAVVMDIGEERCAARRRIRKFICPEVADSCQLTMGYTELLPNSVWNTMPPHTHGRRMEVYLYFDLGDGLVVHLMGPPGETRHLLVRNKEAAVSPPWSIHSGAGTQSYCFVWGMAGENQDFADIDPLTPAELM